MSKLSDQWQTPADLFQVLDKGGEYQGIQFEGFNFDIDLCATKENSKCVKHCDDYLNQKYCCEAFMRNLTCFMNPPYSNPRPFIEKAWEDSKHCKIVCLVKCDPSTKWWSTFWNYEEKIRSRSMCINCVGRGNYNHNCVPRICKECDGTGCKREIDYPGPKPGCQVLFFPKRIKFDPPQELINNGTVWKEGESWVQTCDNGCTFVKDKGEYLKLTTWDPVPTFHECYPCKGKGYKQLSGPTFPSALVIMDRRNHT